MRNSNSKQKNSAAISTQNRLTKTQIPPKNSAKQSLNATQYRLPPSSKKIETTSKTISTGTSVKQIPKQQIDYDIQRHMTQSKIYTAKESLQLLKKKMNRTGMSRQKITPSIQSTQKIIPPPESMKKIKSQTTKNIENYQPKYQQPSYNNNQYQVPSGKIQSKKSIQPKVTTKKTIVPPPEPYYNQQQEIPITKKPDFNALLEKQLQKQQNLKNISANNSNLPINKNQKMPVSQYADDNQQLFQCGKGCGRMFNSNVLPKHQKICQKVFQSKRKVFNTAAQRQLDEAQTIQKPSNTSNKLNQTKKPEQKANKVPKWKLQSAQFRAGLKACSDVPLTAQQKALNNMQNDLLVPCNYCGRKFNQNAAERHIPYCQKKFKLKPKPNVVKKR